MSFIAGGFPKRIMNVYWPRRGAPAPPITEFRLYFAVEPFPNDGVEGPPVPMRAAFEARLAGSGYTTETFESYTPNVPGAVNIAMNGAACQVTQEYWFEDLDPCPTPSSTVFLPVIRDVQFGAYNTTPGGQNYLQTQAFCGAYEVPGCPVPAEKLKVVFTFSTPVAAFGFYGTDWGDFSPTGLTITITDTDDVETTFVVYPGLENPSNLIFWGFVDNRGTLYKKIVAQTTANDWVGGTSADVLGFDDIIFCTLPYITTDPP